MRRSVLVAVALLASVISAADARSDPGPTIRYLMDEPVSMLTFGLWKLQPVVATISKDVLGSDYYTYTSYDWDQNRIVLGFGTSLMEGPTKEMCRKLIDRTRATFGISPADGKPVLSQGHSFIGSYFEQNGHRRPDEPKELGQKLDEVILIQFVSQKGLFCQAPLLGTNIDYRE